MRTHKRILVLSLAVTVVISFGLGISMVKTQAMETVSTLGMYLQYKIWDKKEILMENSTAVQGASISEDFRQGEIIEQPFVFTEDMFQYDRLSFAIQIATLARKNEGTFTIQICQGETVTEKTFQMEKLDDNSFIECDVKSSDYEEGDAVLKCFCNEDALDTIRVYMTTDTKYSDNILVFGEEKELNLMMRVLCSAF